MYSINRLFNPEIYQGKYKHKDYFEGWYYKLIDRNSENIFAFIPGVSITKGEKHAFIQFINAGTGFSKYIKYPFDIFNFSEKELDIKINNNQFNRFGLEVDFQSEDTIVKGKIEFLNIVSYPKSILNPGIMGPYSFVPFMECHHGIVNIFCQLSGTISINGKEINFDGGSGYLEKDWGSSFPESWIWLQSNHFEDESTSVMFSIASIPWIGKHFDGLISFVKTGDKFYRLATYTGARINKLEYSEGVLVISIEDSKYMLALKVKNTEGVILKAPKKGQMNINITETMLSQAEVDFSNKTGGTIFHGLGKNTGLELAGKYEKFFK